MELLLYAPEYRPNLSNMIRSAEFFGFKQLYIYDKNKLLDPPTNKTTRADMNHLARVWTAGAIEFIEIKKIVDIDVFMDTYPGRKLATVIDNQAINLNIVEFQQEDLIIMGPEKEGLPNQLINQCTEKIHIPALGNTDCLNVSVSLGIFLYTANLSLTTKE